MTEVVGGEEFTRLSKAVKDACDATKFKSVHFIWMQGESDAGRDLGVAYERSFKVLVERLKKEIGIEQMHFVIGRITDFGLHSEEKKAGWEAVRKAQQKLGDEDPLGTWINTDDFIAEEVKKKQGDLHYTREESVKLGVRFGESPPWATVPCRFPWSFQKTVRSGHRRIRCSTGLPGSQAG